MKQIKSIFGLVLLLAINNSCTISDGIDKDTSFLSTAVSSNNASILDISTDNSGNVTITPTGNGVNSFLVNFGHGTGTAASADVAPGGKTTHAYPEGSYTVSIVSTDIAGHQTTKTYPLQVTYRVPENLAITIGGDMTVSAKALYANSFLVYYGDVANEVGTPMAVGQTLPKHIYPAGGPYNLKVVAQSGGAAKAEATQTLFGFPLDFESPTMNYFFGTFGNVAFAKIANPFVKAGNTSATVAKYTKTVGAETWSGTYSPLNIPIDFALGNKVKVMVYNADSTNLGKTLNVELESAIAGTGATANGIGVLKSPIKSVGAWEELTFDFSTKTAIGATARFGQLVFRFNDAEKGKGEVLYIDNIRLTK